MRRPKIYLCSLLALAIMACLGMYVFDKYGSPHAANSSTLQRGEVIPNEIEVLRQKADRGNDDAALQLYFFYKGRGDKEKALRWLLTSSELGNLKASAILKEEYSLRNSAN